jgi:hypothetical protein
MGACAGDVDNVNWKAGVPPRLRLAEAFIAAKKPGDAAKELEIAISLRPDPMPIVDSPTSTPTSAVPTIVRASVSSIARSV